LKQIQNLGMTGVMQNAVSRFWAIEHPTGNLIAIVLITIGRGAAKKKVSDRAKHKKSFWCFLIAFVILMATIPWPGRQVARPLFPGMEQTQ
jgi:4-hydroxybenzoate polyprenyltransferase